MTSYRRTLILEVFNDKYKSRFYDVVCHMNLLSRLKNGSITKTEFEKCHTECVCGCVIQFRHYLEHLKSKKHKKHLKENQFCVKKIY